MKSYNKGEMMILLLNILETRSYNEINNELLEMAINLIRGRSNS